MNTDRSYLTPVTAHHITKLLQSDSLGVQSEAGSTLSLRTLQPLS